MGGKVPLQCAMDDTTKSGFTGEILDRYLAAGWYRMGARMFTCRYNFYPNGFLTTVWTRLPLAGHTSPKSVRRLLRRNAAVFRCEVHQARAGEAEERVFAAYRADRGYDLHRTAGHYLRHDPDVPFDTWQLSVYDEDVLVAFAYFDRGRESLQSVCGYYLPAYASYSLGLYTLALEVEQAKHWGMAYHYAGYIVPGNDSFEYKRRVGDLEAYDDVERNWYPLADMDLAALPDAVMRSALLEFDALYRSLDLSYGLRFRPTIQIPFGRESLSWLRREQLPFCVFDETIAQQPFWACHLYSYNFRRYFTLLCTRMPFGDRETAEQPDEGATPRADLSSDLGDDVDLGVGIALECLYYSARPYTPEVLTRLAEVVSRANAFARDMEG